jgi:hypothetical protein
VIALPHDSIIAFRRGKADQTRVVIISFAREDIVLDLEWLRALWPKGKLVDLVTGKAISGSGLNVEAAGLLCLAAV